MSTRIASDIGSVVRTERDAVLYACAVIPGGAEGDGGRFWVLSARRLLVGMCLHCMRQHGQNWGWPHLAALLALPADRLLPLLAESQLVGRRIVGDRLFIGDRLPSSAAMVDSLMRSVAAYIAAAACLHTAGAGKTSHGLRPTGADDEV